MGTTIRPIPTTASGCSGVESGSRLASPLVVSVPSSPTASSRCETSPGLLGSSNTSTAPGSNSWPPYGSATNTSPTPSNGSIEPELIATASQPTIGGMAVAQSARTATTTTAATATRPTENLANTSLDLDAIGWRSRSSGASDVSPRMWTCGYVPACVSQVNVRLLTVSPMRVLSVALDPDGVKVTSKL